VLSAGWSSGAHDDEPDAAFALVGHFSARAGIQATPQDPVARGLVQRWVSFRAFPHSTFHRRPSPIERRRSESTSTLVAWPTAGPLSAVDSVIPTCRCDGMSPLSWGRRYDWYDRGGHASPSRRARPPWSRRSRIPTAE
jgi:hypothetical protein